MPEQIIAKVLPGNVFGRLVVESVAANNEGRGRGGITATCHCKCGKSVEVLARSLASGRKASCGCAASFLSMGERARTHGLTGDPVFNIWKGIKKRCYNKSCDAFRYYGARGIRIADEWLTDFPAFLAHVGPRPSLEHSIERIDNDRNYEPGNVRWATRIEQGRNKRNNVRLVFNGEVKTITEWARLGRIRCATLRSRIFKLRWTVRDTLTIPPRVWPSGESPQTAR